MAAAKEYNVFCVDISPSMDQLDRNRESHLSTSVKIMNQLVQQKMFAGSKDEFAVVLCGTADTSNQLALSEGGYENISIMREMAVPDLDFLYNIEHKINSEQYADFVDALVVSVDVLMKAVEGKKKFGDLKVFLFTDAASQHSNDGLSDICAGMRKLGIQLLVIGPDIDDDRADDSDSGEGGVDGDGGDDHHPRGASHGKWSAKHSDGERLIKSICAKVEGQIFSFREALKLVSVIQTRAKKQTTRFTGHLEIGSKLRISCKMFTKTMSEKAPTWKKLSAISQTSANPGTMSVHLERSYHKQDDDETEVDMEDVAKGYRYGKSLIPISSADEDAMKLETERCLQVLGFTRNENVGPHLYLGTSVLVVVATPGDGEAGRGLSGLIRALYETECCAVARYIWRAKAQPKLVVLKPCVKKDYECLLLVQLPFSEDVRSYYFPSFDSKDKTKLTAEQLEAVDHLITSMDLMDSPHNEQGSGEENFKPKLMYNPLLQRLYQCIRHRSMYPDQLLPDLDPLIASYLQPPTDVATQSVGPLQRINDLFPLVEVSGKAKEKKTAADVWKESGQEELNDGPSSKQPRLAATDGDETDFSMVGLTRGVVKEVGTLDPVKDYMTLLVKDDGSDFEIISRQLQDVIVKLVKESFGDMYYEKALNCVRTLRQQALKHEKPSVFNAFLADLKDDLIGTRYSPFWTKIVDGSIGPITKSECVQSDVSGDDVTLEPTNNTGTTSEPPQTDQQEDADDLLEMM